MRFAAILALGLFVMTPALTHHNSDSGMDVNTVITVDGTINEFSWRNPHIYFTIASQDESGDPVEWTVQMAGIRSISRMGWSADILQPGDRVSIGLHPAVDGRPYGLFDSGSKEGTPLPTSYDSETGELRFSVPTALGRSPTLEGRWMSDGQQVTSYVDGYAGYTLTHLRLNEKAEAARQAYDMFSLENPETACLGRPTPAMIFYADLFPIEIEFREAQEIVEIRGQFFDEVRTIYMDGREHPPADERFHLGHSIGHWEGDTLVVDTRNFNDTGGFYGGAGGHFGWDENLRIVERFSLYDAETLLYRFEIDDPTAFTRPWKGELTMTRTTDNIYEYACHEANYSMTNLLRGARATERRPPGPARRF